MHYFWVTVFFYVVHVPMPLHALFFFFCLFACLFVFVCSCFEYFDVVPVLAYIAVVVAVVVVVVVVVVVG